MVTRNRPCLDLRPRRRVRTWGTGATDSACVVCLNKRGACEALIKSAVFLFYAAGGIRVKCLGSYEPSTQGFFSSASTDKTYLIFIPASSESTTECLPTAQSLIFSATVVHAHIEAPEGSSTYERSSLPRPHVVTTVLLLRQESGLSALLNLFKELHRVPCKYACYAQIFRVAAAITTQFLLKVLAVPRRVSSPH